MGPGNLAIFILHTSSFRLMTDAAHCNISTLVSTHTHHIYTHNVIIMPDLETCNVRGEAEQRATCLAWFLHNNLTKDYLYCNTRNWLWWTWTRLNWRIEDWKHDGCHHPAQLVVWWWVRSLEQVWDGRQLWGWDNFLIIDCHSNKKNPENIYWETYWENI